MLTNLITQFKLEHTVYGNILANHLLEIKGPDQFAFAKVRQAPDSTRRLLNLIVESHKMP